MRLTTFTDYSLRVLIYLAAEPGRRATIAQIAQSFGISESHLTKVVHFLGRAGLLHNVRGKGGGLQLARPAAAINVGQVVRATESNTLPAECFDPTTNRCSITPVCRLRGALQEAAEAFYAVLERHTLEDIAQNREALAQVMFVERPWPPAPAPQDTPD